MHINIIKNCEDVSFLKIRKRPIFSKKKKKSAKNFFS